MRLSYSALDAFGNCPAKYKFQYVDKIKTPKPPVAIFGTLMHDCLKFFHEPDALPPSEEELIRYFTNKWDSSIYTDQREEAFNFSEAITILKRYFLQHVSQETRVVSLEMPFEATIDADGQKCVITGRIDRIDKLPAGGFEVIDYKTARKMPAQDTVDSNLQLAIYYLGLIGRWPNIQEQKRPVRLSLYYLRHGEKLSTVKDAANIDESKRQILSLVKKIQQSDFAPKSSPLCAWCPYQPYCPLFRHKFLPQDSPVPDQEKIHEAIREFFAIKKRQSEDSQKMAQLKQMINRYCDANNFDRIFGAEGYITRQLQKRFGYDMTIVKRVLEKVNKWDAVLTVNQTKLKKEIAALPHLLRQEIEQTKKLEKEFRVISATRQ